MAYCLYLREKNKRNIIIALIVAIKEPIFNSLFFRIKPTKKPMIGITVRTTNEIKNCVVKSSICSKALSISIGEGL